MAIEAVGGFFYLYVTWQGPQEDFLQFCFLQKNFPKNDKLRLINIVCFLGVKLTLSSQNRVKDFYIISGSEISSG
jgi:hypothetical protein